MQSTQCKTSTQHRPHRRYLEAVLSDKETVWGAQKLQGDILNLHIVL